MHCELELCYCGSFGVSFECTQIPINFLFLLLMVDILFIDRTDHNAYMDAATLEIKDDVVGVSEATPRDFNQEQVRTIRVTVLD